MIHALHLSDFAPCKIKFAMSRVPMSGEKSGTGTVDLMKLHRKICDEAFVRSCLEAAYPSQTQSALCNAASLDLCISPETVRRWLHGLCRPGFVAFWPVVARVLSNRGPETLSDMMDILGEL